VKNDCTFRDIEESCLIRPNSLLGCALCPYYLKHSEKLKDKINYIAFKVGQLNFRMSLIVSILSLLTSVSAFIFSIDTIKFH